MSAFCDLTFKRFLTSLLHSDSALTVLLSLTAEDMISMVEDVTCVMTSLLESRIVSKAEAEIFSSF